MSSFGSISTAMTALQAHRRALDVTGHNIANVNTPGYTRQRVDLEPRHAAGSSSLMYNQRLAGAGVEVVGTSRLGDEFLTARVRSQTSLHADLQARAETLTEVERLLSEPGDTGLAHQLSQMWNAWSTLGNTGLGSTGTLAAQEVLGDKTQAVIDSLRTGHAQVTTLWEDLHGQAASLTTEVNTLSAQIADLNGAVLAATKDGAANELLDQRDQLVTRMVELTGATAVPAEDGMVNVYLGGSPAVAGIHARSVALVPPGAVMGGAALHLAWEDGGEPVSLGGGQLSGTFASLNETLPRAARRYDAVADELVSVVNAEYARTGDPQTFFAAGTSGAAALAMTDRTPASLRAGDPGKGVQDGSVARAVGELRHLGDGPDALWQQHVVAVGVDVQAATARTEVVQQTLTTALADQQSAVGVSLDEETANLLVVQRAYEGAARVLTAVDQALDTLINRTGLVGR